MGSPAYTVSFDRDGDAHIASRTMTLDQAMQMARRLMTDPAWGRAASVTITPSGVEADTRPLAEIEGNIIA